MVKSHRTHSVSASIRRASGRLQRIEREIAEILERFPELRAPRPQPVFDQSGSFSRVSVRVTRSMFLH